MVKRIVNPLKLRSFFLFGARGTGKSYLLRELFPLEKAHYIDLLDIETADRLILRPSELQREIEAIPPVIEWVIIDEVQKIPKILDTVHRHLESEKNPKKFALTGSSARKLKRGAANLLAGRAFVNNL